MLEIWGWFWKYREEDVLSVVGEVFWMKGFCVIFLDDFMVVMGMNCFSIYNVFGNKEVVYCKVFC